MSSWLIHVQLRDRDRSSQSHADKRSTYLKEAEISNYRWGGQGDRRDRLSQGKKKRPRRDEKSRKKNDSRGLSSSSSALSDKLSGCTEEEQSNLLRGVHLLCGSSASFSGYTLNVKPHWAERDPGRHGDRSRPSLEQRQVVTVSWLARWA